MLKSAHWQRKCQHLLIFVCSHRARHVRGDLLIKDDGMGTILKGCNWGGRGSWKKVPDG